MKTMTKIQAEIVIPIWNRKEMTEQCIEQICKSTKFPFRLILVDNGSEEPTQKYLESLKDDPRFELKLIRNEENLGCMKGFIQGFKASNAEFVFNMDNDVLVTEGCLEEMIRIAKSDPTIGIVRAASRSDYSKRSAEENDLEANRKENIKLKGRFLEVAVADAFCNLTKREVIDKIGYWNEIFSPGYFDESEYCLRAQDAGYKSVVALGTYCYHKESGSFTSKEKKEIFERNKKIFIQMFDNLKRILYVVGKEDPITYEVVKEKSYEYGRRENFVWVIRKEDLPKIEMNPHGNIEHFQYPVSFFNLRVLWRILTRQKKKFNSIYVSNPKLKKILAGLRFIHRAKVELLP